MRCVAHRTSARTLANACRSTAPPLLPAYSSISNIYSHLISNISIHAKLGTGLTSASVNFSFSSLVMFLSSGSPIVLLFDES